LSTSAESPETNPILIDTRGLNCPLPVIRSRKIAKELDPGTRIIVECTDPLSKIDIPHFAKADGHQLISMGVTDEIFWFLVELGGKTAN
jgi:tRNA 2-thiouridine synthesizing protein A